MLTSLVSAVGSYSEDESVRLLLGLPDLPKNAGINDRRIIAGYSSKPRFSI